MSQPRYLFVYGTLRRRVRHPMARLLARHAKYRGPASLAARLYRVGNYPGVVCTRGLHRVRGDLFELPGDGQLLCRLDDYEGILERRRRPPEYLRKALRVQRPGGGFAEAWVYCYNRPVTMPGLIRRGDWLANRPVHAIRPPH